MYYVVKLHLLLRGNSSRVRPQNAIYCDVCEWYTRYVHTHTRVITLRQFTRHRRPPLFVSENDSNITSSCVCACVRIWSPRTNILTAAAGPCPSRISWRRILYMPWLTHLWSSVMVLHWRKFARRPKSLYDRPISHTVLFEFSLGPERTSRSRGLSPSYRRTTWRINVWQNRLCADGFCIGVNIDLCDCTEV